MAIPSERELLSFFNKRRNDTLTVREIMHAFSVERSQQTSFQDWLDTLARDKRILRLKSKQYRAAPASKGPEALAPADRLITTSRRERFGAAKKAHKRDGGGFAKPGGGFAKPGGSFAKPGGGFSKPGGGNRFGGKAPSRITSGGAPFRSDSGRHGNLKGEMAREDLRPPNRQFDKKREPRTSREKWQADRPPPPEMVGVFVEASPRPVVRVTNEDMDELFPLEGDYTGISVGDAAVFSRNEGGSGLRGKPRGESLSLVLPLGDPKQPRVAAHALAAEYGFIARFSDQAERVARQFGQPELDEGRIDLRALPLCTIDGQDAKDFDDAVYAEPNGNGYRLIVAIADVGFYVKPGNIIDNEGYTRGTSLYLPGFAMPMLPHALSDNLCSLRPEVDRLALVADMQVSTEGLVTSSKSYRALIRSAARLTYREVEDALHKGVHNKALALGKPLLDFAACSRLLRAAKARRGAVDLDLPELELVIDDKGLPTGSEMRVRLESHRLIEDAMLAANSAIAREMNSKHWPAAYRVHEEPKGDRLESVRLACSAMGIKVSLPDAPKPRDLQILAERFSKEPKSRVLLPLVLRCMARAHYSPNPIGHYALAEPDYLHFTSPIRRFPDLIVHRSLTSQGKEAPRALGQVCEFLSDREQSAERCERSVDDYYRCLIAQKFVGEEFTAQVTTVLDFGVFARIEEPYLEGLIPMRTLGENFELDAAQTRLRASRSGASIGLGDEIKIKLKEVRLQKRQISFEWLRPSARAKVERPVVDEE